MAIVLEWVHFGFSGRAGALCGRRRGVRRVLTSRERFWRAQSRCRGCLERLAVAQFRGRKFELDGTSIVNLVEFLSDNDFEADLVNALFSLRPGASTPLGAANRGADVTAPLRTLRRVF